MVWDLEGYGVSHNRAFLISRVCQCPARNLPSVATATVSDGATVVVGQVRFFCSLRLLDDAVTGLFHLGISGDVGHRHVLCIHVSIGMLVKLSLPVKRLRMLWGTPERT